MIHYVKITNFGPVKDEVEINFEVAEQVDEDAYEVTMPDGRKLLKLAYIYGANASGKTTVLKAFEFLRKLLLQPIVSKSATLDFEPFLFQEAPYEQPSRFELSFYAEGTRYIYEISFTKQAVISEKIVAYWSAKPTEIFSRSTDMGKRLASIEFGSKIKVPVRERDLLESNTLHNNTVIGAYAKTNVDIPELEKLDKWFNVFLLGMISSAHDLTETTATLIDQNPMITRWINTFLNKADYQIVAVNVSDSNDQIGVPLDDAFPNFGNRFSNEGRVKVTQSNAGTYPFYGGPSQRRIDFIHQTSDQQFYPLSILAESSGTKRYFGLGGPLHELIHGARLLCIDELETSLHPDLMKHFLQVFLLNAKSSQLLVTTHNISLLENQDFIRRDALWFSEKKDNGAISLYSAADFDSATLRKDASIINAYRSGKLGAKPNLGSPYLRDE
ncbi:ATP-binding protein [Chitinophaga agrisoli]|uniref:ATP-binding protein n=1 Tax=Chitinophaga agrisoli TaxID=2607653 RepID=A0A5B2VK53_9BACT|nr:ATP-binding protein [Chitinophaga agrisoli]KAA2238617.1 ATP-binding protein [Chitinophaga agrisoli]